MPKSVVRSLKTLDILRPSGDGLSHAQIIKTLGIPKSSVSPILRDLTSHDFISYHQFTKNILWARSSPLWPTTILKDWI